MRQKFNFLFKNQIFLRMFQLYKVMNYKLYDIAMIIINLLLFTLKFISYENYLGKLESIYNHLYLVTPNMILINDI